MRSFELAYRWYILEVCIMYILAVFDAAKLPGTYQAITDGIVQEV